MVPGSPAPTATPSRSPSGASTSPTESEVGADAAAGKPSSPSAALRRGRLMCEGDDVSMKESRHKILLPVPEHREDSDTDGGAGPRCESAATACSGQPVKIPDGLTVRNTFFDILGGNEPSGGGVTAGPTTCPLPTQGWWSSSQSQASSQAASPTLITPAPLVEDFGPTPSWSAHNTPSEGQRQQAQQSLNASRKMWADATPDPLGPTPDVCHPAVPSAAAVGRDVRGRKGSKNSHFAKLLAAEAADDAVGDGGGDGDDECSSRGAPSPTARGSNIALPEAPPIAPPAPAAAPPPQPPPMRAPPTLGTSYVQLANPPGVLGQYGVGSFMPLQCLIPNSVPTTPPRATMNAAASSAAVAASAAHADHDPMCSHFEPRLDLQGQRQRHAGGRAGRCGGSPVRPSWNPAPWGDPGAWAVQHAWRPLNDGWRSKPQSESPSKCKRSQWSPTRTGRRDARGAAVAVSDGEAASPKEKRPTRHRGSKEARDPDPWPDDPFEGLPCSAFIDLGDLVRAPAEDPGLVHGVDTASD